MEEPSKITDLTGGNVLGFTINTTHEKTLVDENPLRRQLATLEVDIAAK